SWQIPDQDIWEDRNERWSLHTTVRVHWVEEIKASALREEASPDGDFTAGTLQQAAHSFREGREALPAVEGGQPQSLLPDLSATQTQNVRFMLYGSPAKAFFAQPRRTGQLSWGRLGKSGTTEATFVRPPMRLSLAAEGELIDKSEDTK